jgi:hypothetical protein
MNLHRLVMAAFSRQPILFILLILSPFLRGLLPVCMAAAWPFFPNPAFFPLPLTAKHQPLAILSDGPFPLQNVKEQAHGRPTDSTLPRFDGTSNNNR